MKKNIIIIGGNFVNKGAEAMTLICANEMSQRYPDCNIVLLSDCDYGKKHLRQKKVRIKVLPLQMMSKRIYSVMDLVWALMCDHDVKRNSKIDKIMENAYAVIDVSGYELFLNADVITWKSFINYMHNIAVTKSYGIDMYLYPQSFGPFKCDNKLVSIAGKLLLKHYLTYPKKIYAREKDGYEAVKPYTSANLVKSNDMVLTYKGKINTQSLYSSGFVEKEIDVAGNNNVAIIPSVRNTTKCSNLSIINRAYGEIIDLLLKQGKSVWVVAHSMEDINVCKGIKKRYSSDERVNLMVENLTFFEFEKFISQFEFAVASRYHSIIHAYKQATPCVVLGWAVKYEELLCRYEQQEYLFDVRNMKNTKKLIETVLKMCSLYERESDIIRDVHNTISNVDIYEL